MDSLLVRDILDAVESAIRAGDDRTRAVSRLVELVRYGQSTEKLKISEVYSEVMGEAPGATDRMDDKTKARYNQIAYLVRKANKELGL